MTFLSDELMLSASEFLHLCNMHNTDNFKKKQFVIIKRHLIPQFRISVSKCGDLHRYGFLDFLPKCREYFHFISIHQFTSIHLYIKYQFDMMFSLNH